MKRITFLIIISILFLIPYYWMVVISLEPESVGTNASFHLIPNNMTFENYIFLLSKTKDFYMWVFNSLFVSIVAVLIVCLTASMAGYVMARRKFPGAGFLFMIFLSSMAIPGNILLLPRYILMKELHLINTYLSMFIFAGAGAGGMFLMKQIIQTLPDSMLESAMIDGASEWKIFTKIVLPLIKPGVISLGIFAFVGTYNDYFWQMLMISSPSLKTLPLAVATFASKWEPKMQLTMAAAFIASLPLLILFFIFHKHFIEGIRIGGVKE